MWHVVDFEVDDSINEIYIDYSYDELFFETYDTLALNFNSILGNSKIVYYQTFLIRLAFN